MATRHEQFERDDILKCSQCDGIYFAIEDLKQHEKMRHVREKQKKYVCSECNKSYARKRNMDYHRRHCGVQLLGEGTQNDTQTHSHNHGFSYNDKDSDDENDENGMKIVDQHAMQRGEGASDEYSVLASAFGKSIITFRKNIQGCTLNQIYTNDIPEKVSEESKIRGSFKWYTSMSLQFYQPVSGAITEPPVVFNTNPQTLLRYANYDTISQQSKSAFDEIEKDIETFCQNGSGWVIDKIIASDISIANLPKGINV